MTRKSFSLAILTTMIFTISSLFIACPLGMQGVETGSLTITMNGVESRTISPSSTDTGVVSYRVNGVYADGETSFNEVESSETVITVDNLLVGNWTITIDGMNASELIIASKTQVVNVKAQDNNTATFYLELLSGTGIVSITTSWPSSITSFTQIRVTITPTVTGKEGFVVATSEATMAGGFSSITQTIEDFPTGSYQFTLEFLDDESNPVGLPYLEALNVYKDLTSSKIYDVPEVMFPVETPVITMNQSYQVSIACVTDGVIIYYTIDGSDPSLSSDTFENPFTIAENTTVKAIAVREDRLSSAVATENLEVPAASPFYSPAAGVYDVPQLVTLSSDTIGGTFYFTVDGSDPNIDGTLYETSIAVLENTTVKAVTAHPDHSNSSIATAEYRIRAGIPTFSLREGSYSGTQTISLSSATEGATIYFTLDGQDPDIDCEIYSDPIACDFTTTIKALAVKANMEPSDIAKSVYTINTDIPVATPTFTLLGGTYEGEQEVEIETETVGATIFYTVDGQDPDLESDTYSVPIVISENTVLKAYAILAGSPDSTTASVEYFIKPFLPEYSVESGTYTGPKTITLSSATPGVTFYYAFDGNIPTRASKLYEEPFIVDYPTIVRAIAIKDNMTDSDIATAEYVIQGVNGLSAIDPANYIVTLQLPDGWDSGTIIKGACGTLVAQVSPTPASQTGTYTWYIDGEIAKNRIGGIASTTQLLEFGVSSDEVYLNSGPHIISVNYSEGNMNFSDHRIIVASSTGTVGTVDTIYKVRDIGPSGGYVFYDNPNYLTDGWRFLEAAPARWNDTPADPYYIFGYYYHPEFGIPQLVGTNTAVGTGEANTLALVTKMGDDARTSFGEVVPFYAAKVCSDLSLMGYDDWFLPSKDELALMYQNLKLFSLGGFSDASYWSSSEKELTSSDAWLQSFYSSSQNYTTRNSEWRVRPIRAFE